MVLDAADELVCAFSRKKLRLAVRDLQLIRGLRLKEPSPAGAQIRSIGHLIENVDARADLIVTLWA